MKNICKAFICIFVLTALTPSAYAYGYGYNSPVERYNHVNYDYRYFSSGPEYTSSYTPYTYSKARYTSSYVPYTSSRVVYHYYR